MNYRGFSETYGYSYDFEDYVPSKSKPFVGKRAVTDFERIVEFVEGPKGLYAQCGSVRVYPDRRSGIKKGYALLTELDFKADRKGIFAMGTNIKPLLLDNEQIIMRVMEKLPINSIKTAERNGDRFSVVWHGYISCSIVFEVDGELICHSSVRGELKTLDEELPKELDNFITVHRGSISFLSSRASEVVVNSKNYLELTKGTSNEFAEAVKEVRIEFDCVHREYLNSSDLYMARALTELPQNLYLELREYNKRKLRNIKATLRSLKNPEVISEVVGQGYFLQGLGKHPDWKSV